LIVADLPPEELRSRLRVGGLGLRTGPVIARIRSVLKPVIEGIAMHYREHPVVGNDEFADFHVSLHLPAGIRRWIHAQVFFEVDGDSPFKPLPAPQAFPMLEWGLNWCVSSHCHQFLTLHAAVVEKHGRALIMPAPPGSGKSTLCAGLASRGWRLLSDELTLIDPIDASIVAIPRPISLKNASIEVMRTFNPQAVFNPVVNDTVKGSVAHMRPPAESVRRAAESARPGWIVLPRFLAGAEARLEVLSKARAFMHLVDNAFNYNVHGRNGFDCLARVIDQSECYEFTYSRLADAEQIFARLAESPAAAVAA